MPHVPVASDHGGNTGVATATHRLSDAANEERNNIHKHRREPTVRISHWNRVLNKKIFHVASNRKRLPQRVGFEPVRADKVVARSMLLETLKRRPGRFEPLHANWCPQLK